MNNNDSLLVKLYNLYTTILIPAVIILAGVWSLETGSNFTYSRAGGLPIGALTIFIPEVIFGLKWKMTRAFTITCSIILLILLCKAAHYFFMSKTDAPITYYSILFIILTGTVWSLIIEFFQDLREHILIFPQEQWLVPRSTDYYRNKIYGSIWITATLLGTAFTLTVKWGRI